jgi:regulator of replication initiation timing
MDMFSVLFPSTAAQLDRIEEKVDWIMASFAEAKQEWVDYATALQEENAALRTALTEAQATAQTNADALAAFQADDATTDAQQLADQEQAFADDLQKTLDELQEPPEEPEPLPEPGDEPHPDQTLPGDLPPDE